MPWFLRYRGEGMAESAEVAAISGRRLQRAKVQPGPKAAAFGAATMGVAPRKKAADKRGASAGASAQVGAGRCLLNSGGS